MHDCTLTHRMTQEVRFTHKSLYYRQESISSSNNTSRRAMTTDVQHQHERSHLITHASIEDGPASTSTSTSTVSQEEEDDEEPLAQLQFHAASGGAATVAETMTNLAKTCMGTGCLALPFAAKQGGLLLTVFGLVAIAFWNVFSSRRLSACWDMLQAPLQRALPADATNVAQHTATSTSTSTMNTIKPLNHRRRLVSLMDVSALPPPPRGTATLGKVAWYALGPMGLFVLDALTVLLLLGIVIAYNDAIRVFLRGTPFTTHSDALDAVIIAFLIAPLSIVPDMGYLTKTSAAGLTVLGVTLLVVAVYGIFHPSEEDDDISIMESIRLIPWFPVDGLAGASQWFGCCVFGFGIVPLTFNFGESMAEPAKLSQATTGALLFVAFTYIVIGLGLLVLFPNIHGDVLSELPDQGLVPVLTRLAMVVVVMATSPLLIVPCGEILEGKFLSHDEHGGDDEELHEHHHHHYQQKQHRQLQIYVRFGICFVTVGISVGIPEFVNVLTFVGCFCVAFVSFCIPPCLHLVLRIRQLQQPTTSSSNTRIPAWTSILKSSWSYVWVDIVFLIWGLAATGISTAYVFRHSLTSS